MIGTAKEILLWVTCDHRYAPLLCMSRQRLVGLRTRLITNHISAAYTDTLLENLSKRIEHLKNFSDYEPVSTGSISTVEGKRETRMFPKPVLLDVPEIRLVRKGRILPAVLRDHHGRAITEWAFIKMFGHREMMKDLHLDNAEDVMVLGKIPKWWRVREAMRRVNWTVIEERYELPSIWELVELGLPNG